MPAPLPSLPLGEGEERGGGGDAEILIIPPPSPSLPPCCVLPPPLSPPPPPSIGPLGEGGGDGLGLVRIRFSVGDGELVLLLLLLSSVLLPSMPGVEPLLVLPLLVVSTDGDCCSPGVVCGTLLEGLLLLGVESPLLPLPLLLPLSELAPPSPAEEDGEEDGEGEEKLPFVPSPTPVSVVVVSLLFADGLNGFGEVPFAPTKSSSFKGTIDTTVVLVAGATPPPPPPPAPPPENGEVLDAPPPLLVLLLSLPSPLPSPPVLVSLPTVGV